ncbi:MAG: nucleotidyltransferase domain-containing protein [Deltaproteobacteria bacterium]|nr:nucleotidyltransferase domain-containing protein [Deltaproteobacteria bacterium]
MQGYTGDQEIAKQAVAALRTALKERFIAAVLFGSRARGDAHEESDWDLLVIVEGLPEKAFARHLFLQRLLPPGCRGAVSLLAKTSTKFEAHLPPLHLDIALDGQILYDPHEYAAKRLSTLRRIIAKAGLYRDRAEAGDVWRWQKEPPASWTLEWER